VNCVVAVPDYKNGKQGTPEIHKGMMDTNHAEMKVMKEMIERPVKPRWMPVRYGWEPFKLKQKPI
jgi:hypothetical protein